LSPACDDGGLNGTFVYAMLTMATLSGYIALTRGIATLINVPAAQITSYLVSLSFFIGQSKAVPEPIRIMPLPAMPMNEAAALPVRDRIHALDVLRGVAVGGILFANVIVFFGLIFIRPADAAAFPSAHADSIARFLEGVFIDGKFYSVFSLLFGIGFGVQLSRGGDAALARFRRRLRILLVIGLIHAFVFWPGDILIVYALLGFTLPWFERKTDGELIKWVKILLAIPTVLYVALLAVWMLAGPAPSAGTPADSAVPPQMMKYFEALGTGGYSDVIRGNMVFMVGRWADLIMTVRFPKVLGMFVLGLWAVRKGIALEPQHHRGIIKRWAMLGIAIGLPANLIGTWAGHHWAYLPPSPGGLISVVAQAIGVPMLAIGYSCTVALIVTSGSRVLNAFAPVGRMALTNYIMHTLICITLSYGFGFGMWWHTGAARAMEIAVVIIIFQMIVSGLWLSQFRYGPMEWVWRRLTYGRPV
jgi:uncharacterized protein